MFNVYLVQLALFVSCSDLGRPSYKNKLIVFGTVLSLKSKSINFNITAPAYFFFFFAKMVFHRINYLLVS